MEAERPAVDAALDRLLASQGYGVRRRPDEHAGGKWLVRCTSALGGNATLELDVNYMARQPLFGMARVESLPLGDMRASGVLVRPSGALALDAVLVTPPPRSPGGADGQGQERD